MRSDGQRNRDRVLEAAEAVFGEYGIAVSTEAVAQRAGVGIATLFRHFPTKQALVEAVVMARLQRLLAAAEAIAASNEPNALLDLFGLFVAEAASKRVFGDILSHANADYKAANAEIVAKFWRIYAILLARAQQAGVVRQDLDLQDIRALLAGIHQALSLVGDDPGRQEKLIDIVTMGLRPHPV